MDFFVLSKSLRNKITKLIFTEKRNVIMRKLNLNRKNPKKFWREIKSLLKGNESGMANHRIFDTDRGELVISGGEAVFINEFYVNVGRTVHNIEVPHYMYPVNLLLESNSGLKN